MKVQKLEVPFNDFEVGDIWENFGKLRTSLVLKVYYTCKCECKKKGYKSCDIKTGEIYYEDIHKFNHEKLTREVVRITK